MLPELTERNLALIAKAIEKHVPDALLCVDVGHVLTWSQERAVLDTYVSVLSAYKDKLGLLHISSAGSWPEEFTTMYRSVFGQNIKDWHVTGLDLQLAVCEEEMLYVIDQLRSMIGDREIIEVSETRFPELAIADYFSIPEGTHIKNDTYYDAITKQAVLLGYAERTYL